MDMQEGDILTRMSQDWGRKQGRIEALQPHVCMIQWWILKGYGEMSEFV